MIPEGPGRLVPPDTVQQWPADDAATVRRVQLLLKSQNSKRRNLPAASERHPERYSQVTPPPPPPPPAELCVSDTLTSFAGFYVLATSLVDVGGAEVLTISLLLSAPRAKMINETNTM